MVLEREDVSADEPTRVDRNASTPSSKLAPGATAEASQVSFIDWLKDQVQDSFGARLGRYALLRVLGEGGMGVVFAAYDQELDRKVAIKLLRAPKDGPGWDKSWLLNEAKAMARLSHPNIVQVYDVSEEEQQLFVAMEFVVGVSLKEWFKAKKRSWREVVEVCAQAGRGLQAAHEAGLVHCDYKPQNVLVGKDGRVRVLDFGLAQLRERTRAATGREDDSVRTTLLGGTPAYMAPELYRRDEPDARSDQFAFCVALYEGLFGKKPFLGKTYEEFGKAILNGELQPPPADAKVPAHLRKAVLRGLSREPKDRWPSMEALLAELARDPTRTARRWLIGAGVVVLAGLSALNFYQRRALEAELRANDQRCKGAEQQLAAAWGPQRRAEVEAAITGIGATFAARVWEQTAAQLDGYAQAWVAMHTEACEATTVRGEQSSEMMDLRMACLHRAQVGLRAVTTLLADADAETVSRAHQIVDGLPVLARCADVEALRAQVEPPPPHEQEAVEKIRTLLAEVQAAVAAMRLPAARSALAAAKAAAAAVAYGPVHTEVALAEGEVLETAGEYAASERAYSDALRSAAAQRQWAEQGVAATALMYVVGVRLKRMDAGLQHHALARGVAAVSPWQTPS